MLRRKIRNAREARACLDAVQSSGMDRADWAREHGIDARSLNAWRLNLARPGTVDEAVRDQVGELRLVELVAAVPEPVASAPARYVVRVGQLAVEVDGQFEDDALRRLIRVVASC